MQSSGSDSQDVLSDRSLFLPAPREALVMGAGGVPAGSSDFTGTAVVAGDGRSWSGSGTYIQYDLTGINVVLSLPLTYSAVRFPA
jgi:hypothetical protein